MNVFWLPANTCKSIFSSLQNDVTLRTSNYRLTIYGLRSTMYQSLILPFSFCCIMLLKVRCLPIWRNFEEGMASTDPENSRRHYLVILNRRAFLYFLQQNYKKKHPFCPLRLAQKQPDWKDFWSSRLRKWL